MAANIFPETANLTQANWENGMKPKKSEHKPQRELFRVELSLLVDASQSGLKKS